MEIFLGSQTTNKEGKKLLLSICEYNQLNELKKFFLPLSDNIMKDFVVLFG